MRQVTVAATDLFRVAADEYGDAEQWWRIARANRLVDPRLPGLTTLLIPPAGAVGRSATPDR